METVYNSGSTTLNLKNVLKLVLVEIYLKGYVPSDDQMYRNILYVNRHSGRQLYIKQLYAIARHFSWQENYNIRKFSMRAENVQ